jgi:integrase
VFAYAKNKKLRTGDNPASWREYHKHRFHDPKDKKHLKSMPYDEVPELMRRLRIRQQRGTAAVALEFLILTATRTSETLKAQWSEFDLENRVWSIPPERLKRKEREAGREYHRIPLCDRAMELLAIQKEYSTSEHFVFTGYNRVALDDKAMRVLLRSMGVRVTVHGFRASFKTWATEKGHDWHLTEICLDHKVGTEVAQAYLRGDALEKRRPLMEEWASFCEPFEPK